jgi:hypothetical protein
VKDEWFSPAGAFINNWLIPLLCRKAGVPEGDTRGRITSHRARASTLAQLKIGGMTLFELQQMAGHRSPLSTLHYLANIRPTQLARSFARADRTARSIEVLIDRETIMSGGAARGESWMFYDLGPMGFCANWSTCAHRLACPGCEFNVPRASTRGLLLQGREGLQRFRQEVPLTEEESEAVDGDIGKLETLLARLQTTPTPDGRTPAEIGVARSAAALPQKPMSLPVIHSPR